MSRWLTKVHENASHVTQSVILNLFQDLKRCRVRRSRNEFGMTGGRGNDREAVFSDELINE